MTDLNTAKSTIESILASKQAEVDSLLLALSILDTTFAPDLQALKDAQAEADTQRMIVTNLTTVVAGKEAVIVEKDAVIADQSKQIESLQPVLVAPLTP